MNPVLPEKVEVKKPTIFGAITNPTEQFERIRRNPKFGLALFVFTMIGAILIGITTFITANDSSIVQAPVAPGVDAKAMNMVLAVTGVVFGAITIVGAAALCALVTWLLVTLFQGEITFKQAFSLFIHLNVITCMSLSLNVAMYYLFHLSIIVPVTSLASVIPIKGFWHGILSYVDVFQILYTILLAMGLRVIGKISAYKAWTIAILFWLLGALVLAIKF
ncbi:YIP1 family protein [Baia soyae]|uniref:Yip1-like protein n=1 Tax=Baia soyae TaxID=1544746 RepID=A0A4R2RMA6_9BACL|nr:YIP1 family protein [Baia soyae]TCP64283.1 Yip1-like protein [Baia soyae]